ncbi:hypothetical protein ACHAXS_005152 [Conticribra weissflogii]
MPVTPVANRKLSPDHSIAEEVRNEHANGNHRPRFTFHGHLPGIFGQDFSVHVREATPALTPTTTYGTGDGQVHQVSELNLGYTLFVADTDEEDEGTVAIIAVDKDGDNVNGIVHKANGQKMKFVQSKGKSAQAFEAEEFEPPAWSCGVADDEVNSTRRQLEVDGFFDFEGVLEGGNRDHREDNDHDGHHHHSHNISIKNTEKTFQGIKEGLRGSNIRLGKRRKLQTGSYNYQVDIFIEIDQSLVTKTGSLANAIAYVDAIFTGANTIYETEIDTHLSVSHIQLTNYYDSYSSTSSALSQMRTEYSSLGFDYSAKFSGETGQFSGHDLHHALLGRDMGGGIAYVGVLCNSFYGFGLSASLSGGYTKMDNSVVWDMMVTMHEIGHNFNSGHTHSGYSPFIDSCGCTKDGTCTTACPAQLPLAKSSTLMSYCHFGGYSNMMYTFSGKPIDAANRDIPEGYTNSNLAGTFNNEPRRVNAKMYSHVSSRGTCTIAPVGPPPTAQPTPNPSAAPTNAPTNLPTNAPTNIPTNVPTNAPTSVPTDAPTNAPTYAPTNMPTNAPTLSPTNAPTHLPTNEPTSAPTSKPVGPTNLPTPNPTEAPTNTATPPPTNLPTNTPTNAPTKNPTSAPTNVPTNTPTNAPTSAPTNAPTNTPTKGPTSAPTKSPVTPAPTNSPTNTPTNATTKFPTDSPSKAPTKPPTIAPTSAPTNKPTKAPITPAPTNSPTNTPTNTPTNVPTSATNAPVTPAPTNAPTNVPTDAPTSEPTDAPTITPTTAAPTYVPTDGPTKSPSTAPPCDIYTGGACKAVPYCDWQGGQCVDIGGGGGGPPPCDIFEQGGACKAQPHCDWSQGTCYDINNIPEKKGSDADEKQKKNLFRQ